MRLQCDGAGRPDRAHEAERIQGEVGPGPYGEPAERLGSAALKQRAVVLHHEEPPRRPCAQQVHQQPLADPDTGVEHERDVAAGQNLAAEQPRQPHVAECAGDHGDAEHRELPPQNPDDSASPGPRGHGLVIRQQSLRADDESQEHDPRDHLEQENELLQLRDWRAHLANSIDQEESRQRVDGGNDTR